VIPITEYAGRDVAVFGLARSGLSAAKALAAGGATVFAWDDLEVARTRAEAAGVTVRDINTRDWRSFAALVLSPGVPLNFPKPHRVVELARAVGVPVLSDVELFARAVAARAPHARPKVVAVTGTNGKSTTSALIAHCLAASGRDVRLGGNIGRALLDLEPLHAGAVYVLELSSFQLELVETLRADVAVFLNFAPDHLDRHGSLAKYFEAKRRIFRNQGAGDWAILGVDSPETSELVTLLTAEGVRRVAAVSNRRALGRGVSAIGGKLYDGLDQAAALVLDLAQAQALPGAHNGQNAAAAYAACRALGLDRRKLAAAIASFPGLPHRLELAGTVQGVRFINDSKATNAEAAAQALRIYPKVRWIVGGRAKEGGLTTLEPLFDRVEAAYCIGEAGGDFARFLESKGVRAVPCGELAEAVRAALHDSLKAGGGEDVVLLSPACASYDQFRDFEERGDVFKMLVARARAAALAAGAA
jgi:UDP-N-acetylmuramoylalanine--D-glutamate ligase